MSKVWIVGDLHLGHRNICKYRKIQNIETSEQHDEFISNNVLSMGGKRDTLLLLGDCFFTAESLEHLRKFKAHYGNIWWMLGNHDTDNTERQNNVFTAVKEDLVDKLAGLMSYKGVWLSHAPIHPDELRGKRNIHSHMHDQYIKDTINYQCASLEHTDYKPILFTEMVERFKVPVEYDE